MHRGDGKIHRYCAVVSRLSQSSFPVSAGWVVSCDYVARLNRLLLLTLRASLAPSGLMQLICGKSK